MRKRKINPQYLRHITSQEITPETIDVLSLTESIKRFTDEYLGGIINLRVSGEAQGSINLNLPVTTYLIRLLCECGDSDEMIDANIRLGEDFTLTVKYHSQCPTDDAAYIVNVARLAGFGVTRDANTLIFRAEIKTSSIMQIYATSNEDFYNMLIITYKM